MRPWLPAATLALAACGLDFQDDVTDDTGPGDTDVGAPGDLDSIWQPERIVMQRIDPADPFGATERTIPVPAAAAIPEGRGRARTLLSVEDDRLVHWAWVEGESVHWRITEPAVSADGTWIVADADGSRVVSLNDGHLEVMATWIDGDVITYLTTTYGALDGLPADWPTERREGVRTVTP